MLGHSFSLQFKIYALEMNLAGEKFRISHFFDTFAQILIVDVSARMVDLNQRLPLMS